MVKEVKFGGTVEGMFIGGVKVGHSIGKMIYMDIEITKSYERGSAREVSNSSSVAEIFKK